MIIGTKRLNTKTLLKKKNLSTVVLKFMKKIKSFKKSVEEEVINSIKVSKALDEIITAINESKIRRTILLGSLRRLICLGCMIQRCIKKLTMKHRQRRYNKDPYSMELLSIQSFLSEISRGRTKDKERARKELNDLKRNVSSENLKEIVKNLEFAIFGPSESDDDDGEWDNFQESVAERVKKRRQDKISEEELKKHATGYRHLDNTTRDALGKRYNPKPGQEMVFDGFNNIIDDYQSGILSFYDVNAMFKNLNKSVELNNKYYVLVRNGINQVLSLIYDGSIKYNEKAILNSIKNTNKELFNKKYYTTDSKGEIILSDYNAILNKLVSGFNNDP